MVEIFPLKSADAAYSKISGMLSTLGDPFTRIISPKVCMFGLILSSNNGCYYLTCTKLVWVVTSLWMIVHIQEYQSFRIGSDGNVQGVGVFINKEPSSGRLVSLFLFIPLWRGRDKGVFQLLIPNLFQLVMDCIQGGPADRAGIHEGDELVEIDGIYFFILFILHHCVWIRFST